MKHALMVLVLICGTLALAGGPTYTAPKEVIETEEVVIEVGYVAPTEPEAFTPLHACDDARDCEREVERTCRQHGSQRAANKPVTLSFNSSSGSGTCSGDCANGGSVKMTCLETK